MDGSNVPRSRVVLVALVSSLAGIAASLVPSSASANNWYGETNYANVCPLNGNMTDNKDVGFTYVDLSSELTQGANFTRDLLEPTDLDTFYVFSGDMTPATDVVMRDRYYTDWCEDALGLQWTTDGFSGLRGIAACYSTTPAHRCEQQVVRISNHYLDQRGTRGDRWIACHEIGHAIGLMHRNSSTACMVNDEDVSDPEYTPHDRDHFNANWP